MSRTTSPWLVPENVGALLDALRLQDQLIARQTLFIKDAGLAFDAGAGLVRSAEVTKDPESMKTLADLLDRLSDQCRLAAKEKP